MFSKWVNSPVIFLGRRFFSSGSKNRLASFIALLAMSGLVLGVALLIIVLSVMNGFDREMRNQILAVVPHIQLFQPEGVDQWQQLSERLQSSPAIERVTPFTRFDAMLNARGKVQAVAVQGLLPEYLDDAMLAVLPGETRDWLMSGGLMISRPLADKLGVVPGNKITLLVPRVGDGNRQLSPSIRVLSLAGVFETHTAEDNGLALVNLTMAGEVTGFADKPQGLRITLTDVFDARKQGYRLLHQLPPGFSFIDWFQTHGNLYKAIQMSRKMVGLLIFLIIAIAVFNVVSMLIMTVMDKRPAIATLKTLGADNGSILGIFFVQGVLIGVCGCGLGLVLGVLGALYISNIVAWIEEALHFQFLNSEIYPIDYLPSDFQMGDALLVVSIALGLNFLATLYPAWKAARIKPAEILRYE